MTLGDRWCIDLSCISGKSTRDITAWSAPNDDVTLYKVSGDECGQATIDSKYESEAKAFGGLTDGTCASVGYTIADGTQTLHVPVIGDIIISKFKPT